ncbi:hypothetical protein [Methylobacterium oxalidis]|uniref:Resolvase/invertase-type recombinase catalytic domain-containing protein n=1 Tax=Methylobacterium oxalidis TaxID=944322 RepID=A0A512J7H2_9HYPH|nr:hypothetical protein [Methylobacterium oxalidis]GEP05908.1 hypothetical protein MOX02_39460 [Methylobacterium oxalidis]GJE32517.1 hypothetical protein LDDCCGHA_2703 [Methylobacterium oxalidis]GLS61675.1 hypothetical protein GCM10007888_00560 [Methylobacterium oxalidis]
MNLIVTAQHDGRVVSYQRRSPSGALEKALQLQKAGSDRVFITDITGRAYGPGDFAACFVRARV